jgi:hypothetical protein
MAKYTSGRQKNLKVGIPSYSEDLTSVEVIGNVGIATTNATSKLYVVGDGYFTGVVTSSNFYVGNSLIGSGSSFAQLYVSGVSTFAGVTTHTTSLFGTQASFVGVITANTFDGTLSGYATSSGIATYATNAGIATYATSSGIATYATNAGIATALQNSRTFEITGDIVASPISFNGTGNVSLAATIQPNSVALGSDTTGDYIQSITGTSNQITVTSGTGEGSTPTLSLPSNLVVPQDLTVTRDLQVNRNLNVTGNVTIGGTTAFINVPTLTVFDPDIVLGFRTDAFGNDISNDTTSNHGGVALASTEGTPLVNLFIAGIETNPATYKKIMWFKSGTFAGLGTDAWLINYAVGIGSTQFPTGTRLAAGNVQFTQNDLAVVRNINASGVGTIPTLSGTTATYGTGNFTTGNIVTGIVTTLTSTNATLTNINSSGVSTLGVTTFTGTVSFGTSAYFGDNDSLNFGDSNDLQIYHDSTNSYISDLGTGRLVLLSNGAGVDIVKAPLEYTARFFTDGAVELYYDNVKEFETTGYGATVFGILQTQGLQVSGVSTLGITTTTNLTTQNINNSGITTTNSLNIGSTQVISSARQLQNIASLDATTTATIESAIANAPNTFADLNVTGISTLGVTSVTNLTAQQLNVSGLSTFSNTLRVIPTSTGIAGIFSGTTSEDMVRITQLGTGNAFVVEDSTNPDATPFVVRGDGSVGIGTTNPTSTLTVQGNGLIVGVLTATSFSGNASSATYATSSGISTYAINAGIATYATSSGISTYAINAGIATYATSSGIATNVIGDIASVTQLSVSGISTLGILTVGNVYSTGIITATQFVGSFSGNVTTATYATSAGIATYATSSGISTYATNAGVSTNVIGGIGSITQLIVSGVSTLGVTSTTQLTVQKLNVTGDSYIVGILTADRIFSNLYGEFTGGGISGTNIVGTALSISGISTFTNGPVLIGSATSTGTASQRLQVTGGAYFSGTANFGIGVTNPQYIFTVSDTGTPATVGLTNCLADFTTTANSYGQINLRNTSTGTNASSDVVLTADTGNDSSNFIDLGINNSGFSVGSWTINGPTDGYLYTSDGNLSIGAINASVAKYISFFTGGTLISNERMRVNATGVGIGTTNPLGTLQVGTGITMYGVTGIISATSYRGDGSQLSGISAINVADDTLTNATRYILFDDSTGGTVTTVNVSTTKLTFNPSTGNMVVGGTVTANSDEKLKTNIKTIDNALDKVLSLRGVEYDRIDNGDHQIGVIAQEVEKIIPDVVYPKQPAPDYETKSVAYANLVGLLIEAIKEQNVRMEELERKLEEK